MINLNFEKNPKIFPPRHASPERGAILEGKGHGWWAKLSKATSINKSNHCMHNTWRMDDHFHFAGRKPEKPVSLDQLKPLFAMVAESMVTFAPSTS